MANNDNEMGASKMPLSYEISWNSPHDPQSKLRENITSPQGISDDQVGYIAKRLGVKIFATGLQNQILDVGPTKKKLKSPLNCEIAAKALKAVLQHKNATSLGRKELKELVYEITSELSAEAESANSGIKNQDIPSDELRQEPTPNRLKTLTRFRPDGCLIFDPYDEAGGIWTPTPGQQRFISAFPEHAVMIARGPAGSGKTEFAVRMALGMYDRGEIDTIIISAPVDEGGEEIGYRKGNDVAKMGPHIDQILMAIDGHVASGDFATGQKIRMSLMEQGVIVVKSLGVISGNNLRRTALIVDEAHKAKMPHLLLALTRVHHEGSKIILIGDEKQHMSTGVSPFRAFCQRFSEKAYLGLICVVTYSPSDIRRHRLAQIMAERDDDVPPDLAKRILEETSLSLLERIKLLKTHFLKSAGDPNSTSGLAKSLAEELIRRMETQELVSLLSQELGLADDNAPEQTGPS